MKEPGEIYMANAVMAVERVAGNDIPVDYDAYCAWCWEKEIAGNEDFFPAYYEQLTTVVSNKPLTCVSCGRKITTTAWVIPENWISPGKK